MLAYWEGQMRSGDMALNEFKEDCFMSIVVYNKEYGKCMLFAGPVVKQDPTLEDIRFYFESHEEVIKTLAGVGIILREENARILLS